MAEFDARWYVIHTYTGYEAIVKDSLEKQIENNNLQDMIFDIQIPTEETLEEKANGKKKLVERKKFPAYVFIKMIYSDDIYQKVRRTNGVTGFVGPAGRPFPLTEDEVMRMGLVKQVTDVDFVVGDEVQVISGPLESFSGKIISLNLMNQKAMVNVEMFGRATNVEVEFVQIKKIERHIVEESFENDENK